MDEHGEGTCTVRQEDDGSITVLQADPFIHISRQLIAVAGSGQSTHMSLEDGALVLHAQPQVRYRIIDEGRPDTVRGELVAS